MRAVTATVNVGPDHMLTMQLPADVRPGSHRVVVVLQEEVQSASPTPLLAGWPAAHQTGPVDPNMTYRREDLYDDAPR